MSMQVRPPVLQDVPLLLRLEAPAATHVLEKDGAVIGAAACQDGMCTAFVIAESWRRRGYGTFLMKALLRTEGQSVCLLVAVENAAGLSFCAKFGFEPDGQAQEGGLLHCVRSPLPAINALSVAHGFLMQYGRRGGFALDATAGNGQDTLFLARLVGNTGRVLAMDLQPEAVAATAAAVDNNGCAGWVRTVCDSHENLAQYAAPGSVDIAVFNLGYLPGGDRTVFTTPETSVPAIAAALGLLRRGGVLTACVYAGGLQGTYERDAVLAYFRSLPPAQYTVLITEFAGRSETQAVPVCVQKQ